MQAHFTSDAREHRAVLAAAAVEQLLTLPEATYIDGTFGRGGHSRLILQRLAPRGRLIAFDRDPQAIAAAVTISDPRFQIIHSPFSRMREALSALDVPQVQGVLLDIGISSPQIDDPQRGFSLRADGPLDMRMDTTRGETAGQWLARASVDDIKRVIADYGEERFASSIAKALVARRGERPLATTFELAAVVAGAIPVKSRKDATQHPATRSFQAIRIHINQELEELPLALEQSAQLLAAGGRMVVIAFHSLEDRIVKRFVDAHAHPERQLGVDAMRLPLRAGDLPLPTLAAIARVLPDESEIAANPRARSAVMRVAERTQQPWPDAEGEPRSRRDVTRARSRKRAILGSKT